ncbi:MAG: DoxX family protein [Burkholderiales bacterium]|nr:DoxX family protein [Burkholderiales bacterium]OJX06638.1 MAG: DoxX family protein [Burkholderiales bacterium 70-64]
MDALEKYAPLIGRLGLAWLFVPAGLGKIAGFSGTAGYIASKGLPMPTVLAAIALLVELLGGLAILVGFKTRWAAAALALFTVAAAVFFHNYWALPADQAMMQQINFNKNIGIAGGLLFLVAWGAGAFSLDQRGVDPTRRAPGMSA